MELVSKIADELLAKEPLTKKGIGEIVGGQVLELASDKIMAESRKKGIVEGRAGGRTERSLIILQELNP